MIKNKITNKIKTIPLLMLGIVLAIKNTLYAVMMPDNGTICVYGVQTPKYGFNLLRSLKDFFYYLTIPIILIFGLIVYWKRSKQRKLEKICFVIIFAIIAILLQILVLNNI